MKTLACAQHAPGFRRHRVCAIWLLESPCVHRVYARHPRVRFFASRFFALERTRLLQYIVPPECVRAGTPCMEINTFNSNAIKVGACIEGE